MDLKCKIRTYNFWISLSAAVLIVVRLLGQSLGFYVNSELFMDIATAVCGVLVVLGIIIMPASATSKVEKREKGEKQQSPTEIEHVVAECNVVTEEEKTEDVEVAKEQTSDYICEDIAGEVEAGQEMQDALQIAIEQILKNPTELYDLIKQITNKK